MGSPAPIGTLVLLLLFGAIALVAVVDLRYRRIPNALVGAIAVVGGAHSVFVGGPRGALASFLGLGTGISLLALPFAWRMLGGGDVKLLGAIGVWLGVAGVLRVAWLGAVAGGVLAVVYLLRLKSAQRAHVMRNLPAIARHGGPLLAAPEHLDAAHGIPYGVALSAAAVWVLLFPGGFR